MIFTLVLGVVFLHQLSTQCCLSELRYLCHQQKHNPKSYSTAAFCEASAECRDCVTLNKEEKAMFLAHSEACLPTSGAEPQQVAALVRGEAVDSAALRAHVYCVLLRCKVIGKDGKMLKTAVLSKIGHRADGRNVTKVLERCAERGGETPEDHAWNLFKCGYNKKAVLFEHMPHHVRDTENNDA